MVAKRITMKRNVEGPKEIAVAEPRQAAGGVVIANPGKVARLFASIRMLRLPLLAALLILGACRVGPPEPILAPTSTQVSEVDLPFETIERSERGGGSNAGTILQPALVIIGDPAEIETLDETVRPEALARLAQVDLTRYFVVVAYRGLYPELLTPKSGIEIQRIRREGARVTVEALFYQPIPRRERLQVETYPYHIVQVPREGLQGELTFLLEMDGKVLVQEVYRLR